MKDLWIHRSKRMRCTTCMYFVIKRTTSDSPVEVAPVIERGHIGRCRRHAPTMSGYPVVFESDWCGDHKLNENI